MVDTALLTRPWPAVVIVVLGVVDRTAVGLSPGRVRRMTVDVLVAVRDVDLSLGVWLMPFDVTLLRLGGVELMDDREVLGLAGTGVEDPEELKLSSNTLLVKSTITMQNKHWRTILKFKHIIIFS